MSATPVTQDGLVGLFDILGYQEFLEKNSPETAAEIVRSVLEKLIGLDNEMLLRMMKDLEVLQDNVQEKPQWLVFSDTVMLTLDLGKITVSPEEPSSLGETIEKHWYVFLLQCISLWRSMFEFGLPLRGAITKGSYMVQSACFAGRPIVEAHKLANDLNCAGVVLDSSVVEWHKTKMPGAVGPGVLYFDYLFPSKTKGFADNAALNLTYSLQKSQEAPGGDIRQMVHESFLAHNKRIGFGVTEKVENTERLLRFLKTKWR
jgi:hypothetical protein